MFHTNFVQKIMKIIRCLIFSKKTGVFAIMLIYCRGRQATDQNKMWLMRIACRIKRLQTQNRNI